MLRILLKAPLGNCPAKPQKKAGFRLPGVISSYKYYFLSHYQAHNLKNYKELKETVKI